MVYISASYKSKNNLTEYLLVISEKNLFYPIYNIIY